MPRVDFGRAEGGKEARFPLVEALRVERVPKAEQAVVKVVAELVEERPEERAKRDHLAALRGEHPHRDAIPTAAVRRDVETLELATPERRPAAPHPPPPPTAPAPTRTRRTD